MAFEVDATDHFAKNFKKLSKKYSSLKAEIQQLAESLKENPTQGTPIGRDCYKIRIAIERKGKGKSGGARAITCVIALKQRVVLLAIYDKSERENIETRELKELLKNI